MADDEKDRKPSLAVALKYDRGKDPAPRVVAKGKGTIAEQIVRIAEEHVQRAPEAGDRQEQLGIRRGKIYGHGGSFDQDIRDYILRGSLTAAAPVAPPVR